MADVDRRRVILATNIAETSLTVPGVHAVVDTGQHKVARYDPNRAIDSLELERIPLDSADQRAGRAARLGPGLVLRLWDRADRLRPHREAEIHRVDLSGTVLDVLAWGGDPRALEWFEAPSPEALDAAVALLERLGATSGVRLTALGRRMQRLPIHPRLSRILLEAAGARDAALACALLSERQSSTRPTAAPPTTSSDLLSLIDRGVPASTARLATMLQRLVPDGAVVAGRRRRSSASAAERLPGSRRSTSCERLRAVPAGFRPRRCPRQRKRRSRRRVHRRPRCQWPASAATVQKRGSAWRAPSRRIGWSRPTFASITRLTTAGSSARHQRDYYDAIVLSEQPVVPDPDRIGALADSGLSRARTRSRGRPAAATDALRRPPL